MVFMLVKLRYKSIYLFTNSFTCRLYTLTVLQKKMIKFSTSLPLVYFTVGLQAFKLSTSKTGKLNVPISLATACSTCMT